MFHLALSPKFRDWLSIWKIIFCLKLFLHHNTLKLVQSHKRHPTKYLGEDLFKLFWNNDSANTNIALSLKRKSIKTLSIKQILTDCRAYCQHRHRKGKHKNVRNGLNERVFNTANPAPIDIKFFAID